MKKQVSKKLTTSEKMIKAMIQDIELEIFINNFKKLKPIVALSNIKEGINNLFESGFTKEDIEIYVKTILEKF